jgi:activator of HSP90 ATPase
MTSERLGRRDFAVRASAILAGLGFASAARGATVMAARGEITHSSAAIHQKVVFAAPVARVYQALTIADEFDKVVQLSGAMNSGMKKMLGTAPTEIAAVPGGAFSLFGGYVTGRNLELVPNARIVQAWRAGSWDPGSFSIAKFVLSENGAGTKLVFDHTGFPNDAADHLTQGWHDNYWTPLAKSLA